MAINIDIVYATLYNEFCCFVYHFSFPGCLTKYKNKIEELDLIYDLKIKPEYILIFYNVIKFLAETSIVN